MDKLQHEMYWNGGKERFRSYRGVINYNMRCIETLFISAETERHIR